MSKGNAGEVSLKSKATAQRDATGPVALESQYLRDQGGSMVEGYYQSIRCTLTSEAMYECESAMEPLAHERDSEAQ